MVAEDCRKLRSDIILKSMGGMIARGGESCQGRKRVLKTSLAPVRATAATPVTECRPAAYAWKAYGPRGPFSRRPADRNRSTVFFHDLLYRRKTQSRSSLLSGE